MVSGVSISAAIAASALTSGLPVFNAQAKTNVAIYYVRRLFS
jgi:hypothetical protein